jgi:hypothetical protein
MPDHKVRMNRTMGWSVPLPGTAEYAKFEEVMAKRRDDPRWQRHFKEANKRAQSHVVVQQMNGAGFGIDSLLREYAFEYSNRSGQFGLWSMPMSFNISEASFTYVPPLGVFRIRDEQDHLCSFYDFMDWMTSPGRESPTASEVRHFIPEGKVFNITNLDRPLPTAITAGAYRFFPSGVSLVRHGDEVAVLLLVGEEANIESETEALHSKAEYERGTPGKGKENMAPAPGHRLEAVKLAGTENMWRAVAAFRTDISQHNIQARLVAHDCGQYYKTLSDDPAMRYDNYGTEHLTDEQMKGLSGQLQRFNVLFDFGMACIALPRYFSEHADDIVVERHKTAYGMNIAKPSLKAVCKYAPAQDRLAFRNVEVYRPRAVGQSDIVGFRAPELRFETRGYWKSLPPDQVGTDRAGNAVTGKTWVTQTISWTQKDSVDSTILFARRSDVPSAPKGDDPGAIYVMRSAIHPANVFKVGFTRRSPAERAAELTSSTSSPDGFHVMQTWSVENCSAAETRIHQVLAPYRINSHREFFQAPYEHIFEAIIRVLGDFRAGRDG